MVKQNSSLLSSLCMTTTTYSKNNWTRLPFILYKILKKKNIYIYIYIYIWLNETVLCFPAHAWQLRPTARTAEQGFAVVISQVPSGVDGEIQPPCGQCYTPSLLTCWGAGKEGKEMFYLTTHSTHFIYGYMASDIWLRTIQIARKETRCRHKITARVLLYAPSHRQDNTYHSLCYTSCGALAGMRNSCGSTPWRIDLMTHRTMSERSYHRATSRSCWGARLQLHVSVLDDGAMGRRIDLSRPTH